MICKCDNCAAPLLFQPKSGQMECRSCSSVYDPWHFVEENEEAEEFNGKLYSCTACGAQLMVNDIETSTYCSYCGQPTIVFERIASAKKPKWIIPFSVTKEEAVSLIREKLKKGAFVPQEIKDFEVERVRGIYVPFWVFDIRYLDCQYLSGKVGSGKYSHTEYYMREAENTFYNFTVDASVQLEDGVSQNLEPYDTDRLIPFHPAYLSGFYADCFDVDSKRAEDTARYRCKELFDKKVRGSVPARNVAINKCAPVAKTQKTEYALLPAWFLTFRYQDEAYTILVNGQTKKIVGAVPVQKKKVILRYFILFAICFLLCKPAISAFLSGVDELDDIVAIVCTILLGAGLSGLAGLYLMKEIMWKVVRTKAQSMTDFVKNRQEG